MIAQAYGFSNAVRAAMVLGSIRNRKIIASILAAVGIHAAGSHSSVRVAVGYRLPDHRTVRDCQGGSSQWSRVTGERLGVKFPGPTRRSSTTTSRLLSIDANGEPGLSELQLSLGKTFPRVWRCRLWFLRRYWLYRAAARFPSGDLPAATEPIQPRSRHHGEAPRGRHARNDRLLPARRPLHQF
jgi:hypothetical protein